MNSLGSKITIYALLAATGALASNPYLDLAPPFPVCAVAAATSAILSTICHDETLSCVCTDPFFMDAFISAASDYCDSNSDAVQAISILESQCSNAGSLPISTVLASSTGAGWWPPYSSGASFSYSWSGSSYPRPTESCYSSDVSASYTSWITATVPYSSEIETTTTSGVTAPTTQSTAGTITSGASATTPLPTSNDAKGREEKVTGVVGLAVALLGIMVII